MPDSDPIRKSAFSQLIFDLIENPPGERVKRKIAPRQPMVVKPCLICGKEFRSAPSVKAKFCSKECTVKHMSLVPRKPRRGEEVPCPQCGKLSYRSQGQIGSGRIFCNRSCSDDYQRRNRVTKKCSYCGKEYTKSPSQAWDTCSNECRGLARIKRPLDRTHNGRPDHPNRSLKGWQYEHRLVTEKSIGRYLASEEVVHHKDGNKSNNDPSNLEILSPQDHNALTWREHNGTLYDKVAQADELAAKLAEYERRFGPLPDSDPEP
jgi:endogenous inhibitor of DNA gyrase (YacG/DUF329 family)